MLSTPVCHFGGSFGSFGRPILLRRRRATNSSTAPMRILTARIAVDGAVLGFGGLFSVAARVAATTMASDRIHPAMKNAALDTPPLDASTTAKAVKGMGSKVM